MSIKVLQPGLLTSMQDLGRYGYQKHGVIVSGAMDAYSLRIANILVGNQESEGTLEMALLGPSLEIEKDSLLAITGGNLSPTINGKVVPMWRPVYVKAGSILQFGVCKSGCRSYLAIAGGCDLLEVMGSKSTYLRAGIGGFQGRALQRGDVLAVNSPQGAILERMEYFKRIHSLESFVPSSWYAGRQPMPHVLRLTTIRMTRGLQFEYFTAESKSQLLNASFQITAQSDRMGYRLSGVNLQLKSPLEMISEAVALGTVQVPPDGNPIILLADRQTVGGYPKIGQVAIVDVPILAQVRPGAAIQFQEITLEEAERLYIARENYIQELKTAIQLKFL
ncbi:MULTISPECIES: biotin-dependent carboxyltransferase family protein [Pelosinus]|uniref:Urea amidolyase related protein n=1 Tax=Pelosinus fermentans B4 TaxID=1149862 RepID=I9AS40_9FIRM|nr:MULTISPECIES: biotin-dependent carboxyltransferase family protein [Pelosinus]EIW15762.1 urea amidolyase related protein [Pelosinus fermentans B4]EIW27532.1 urea amidolyase related protein [Pelosinus fermentans A11]OAM92498.1 urea amidolyase related protein [Pelosinus fermentans DSM 17108]SDQ46882.1 antagonist of KipI [Pelosinus fermentans]